jgi:hypothetical protein
MVAFITEPLRKAEPMEYLFPITVVTIYLVALQRIVSNY